MAGNEYDLSKNYTLNHLLENLRTDSNTQDIKHGNSTNLGIDK